MWTSVPWSGSWARKNMQLAIMVRKRRATQQVIRWTRVNELRVGRENTDTHILTTHWPPTDHSLITRWSHTDRWSREHWHPHTDHSLTIHWPHTHTDHSLTTHWSLSDHTLTVGPENTDTHRWSLVIFLRTDRLNSCLNWVRSRSGQVVHGRPTWTGSGHLSRRLAGFVPPCRRLLPPPSSDHRWRRTCQRYTRQIIYLRTTFYQISSTV